MRIASLILLISAVAIKLLWHPSWELAWRVSSTMHRGLSASSVAFWLLATASIALAAINWMKSTH